MAPADPAVDSRRSIERTDRLLDDARLSHAGKGLSRRVLKAAVSAAQDSARRGEIAPEDVIGAAISALPPSPSSMHPVLNATGVVIHTNLGRAPLSPRAVEAIVSASGYVDVEYDLASGRRAKRGRAAIEAIASAVPGAEDVHVVNNGAAALSLAAMVLAQGRKIVVSRGELIEIGDGFRLPALLCASGARLAEVGTTNRTTLEDYRSALNPETAMILKVHTSNYFIAGFTSSVHASSLAGLGVPLVVDIGSGLLSPDPLLPDEPDASSMLKAGAALVTASGDKLLGGPQAGLLLGERATIQRIRRHPLARAFRVDKLTLAALEATVVANQTPVQSYLRVSEDLLHRRACALTSQLQGAGVPAVAAASTGVVGGGAAPQIRLPGWAVSLDSSVAPRLRKGDPCVVARVHEDRCLVDLRCIPPEADEALAAAIIKAVKGP